jgi:hypothetical protein
VAIDKLAGAVAKIRSMELEAQKLEVKKVEVEQKGQALNLEARKFNHLRVKSFIEWSNDEHAKEIALRADIGSEAKIEALGQHLFGEAWN